MKKTILHRFFSTFIACMVLLPFAIQTLHALDGHEHVYCSATHEKHYHKKEIDCKFYHLKITYNSYDFGTDFTIYNPIANFQWLNEYHQTYYYLFPSSKSSRAPPYFIVYNYILA